MKLKEPIVCKITKTQILKPPFVAKVAVTGDWHISPIVSRDQFLKIKAAFLEIQPELIILQGDLMDSPAQFENSESVKKLYEWFYLCMSFAPTVMVLGSHDYIEPSKKGRIDELALSNWQKVCGDTGVKLLNDDWFSTEHIRVFGMYQGPDYCLTPEGKHKNNPLIFEKHLNALNLETFPDKVNWFVAHAPDMTKRAEKMLSEKFDVASFGHTHGGCLPLGVDALVDKVGGHGGIISPTKRPLPSDVRGVKKIGKMTRIINSGMVATQNCAPKATQYLNFAKAAEINFVKVGTRKPSYFEL
ncbi:metallophosphoesterase [Candidatus Saccharibacteria bacterium]|nr:metallophosphoesterase [Candidatus Saccharibacteria bacterium]